MALFELLKVDYQVTDSQHQVVTLLDGINLNIEEGGLFTFIGPSGAGKSTLLYLLNRFHDTTRGQIFYAGKLLADYEVIQLRREVGMLLQKPFMLSGTVLDNLMAGPQLSGVRSRRRPEELVDLVGLKSSLLNQEAKSLSGGEQQRVSLARLLANNPRVLLLDEPTAALNQAAAEEVERLIKSLVVQEKLTVVMVTHDLEQAYRMGDTTALLMAGKLIECLPTRLFFSHPETSLTDSYLKENWHRGGGKQ
ncbi:MAG: phosphate ABC transporter ATP-binding protein [Methylocystaceae bacterium]